MTIQKEYARRTCISETEKYTNQDIVPTNCRTYINSNVTCINN